MGCYLVVVVERQFRANLLTNQQTSLVGPRARNIPHSVTTTAKDQGWQVETLDEADAVGMTLHAEIEASQSIARKTVATTLQYNSFRLIPLHDILDDRFEYAFVRHIVDTVPEGKVHRIVFALANANIAKLSSAWEVLSVFVEGDSHDSVSGIEGLFDTVTVMNVDVNV